MAVVEILARQAMLFRAEQQRRASPGERRVYRRRSLLQPMQRLRKLPPPRRCRADRQAAIRYRIRNTRVTTRRSQHRARANSRPRFAERRFIRRNQPQIAKLLK